MYFGNSTVCEAIETRLQGTLLNHFFDGDGTSGHIQMWHIQHHIEY